MTVNDDVNDYDFVRGIDRCYTDVEMGAHFTGNSYAIMGMCIKYYQLPPLLTALFHVTLSVTTRINCIDAFDLINIVHLKAVNLIRSYYVAIL